MASEVERNADNGAMRERTPEGTEVEPNGACTARIRCNGDRVQRNWLQWQTGIKTHEGNSQCGYL